MDMTDREIVELVFKSHDEPLSEITKLRVEKCMILSKRYFAEYFKQKIHDAEINDNGDNKQ